MDNKFVGSEEILNLLKNNPESAQRLKEYFKGADEKIKEASEKLTDVVNEAIADALKEFFEKEAIAVENPEKVKAEYEEASKSLWNRVNNAILGCFSDLSGDPNKMMDNYEMHH